MTQIGDTWWDDEFLSDRVDVYRAEKNQARTGQSLPTFVSVRSNVPCKIAYGTGRGTADFSSTVNLAVDQALVCFAEDVSLSNRDKLTPASPSLGNDLIVSLYRYDSDMRLYTAVCTQSR